MNLAARPAPGPDNINWAALWSTWGQVCAFCCRLLCLGLGLPTPADHGAGMGYPFRACPQRPTALALPTPLLQRILRGVAVLPLIALFLLFPIGVLTGALTNLSTAVCSGTSGGCRLRLLAPRKRARVPSSVFIIIVTCKTCVLLFPCRHQCALLAVVLRADLAWRPHPEGPPAGCAGGRAAGGGAHVLQHALGTEYGLLRKMLPCIYNASWFCTPRLPGLDPCTVQACCRPSFP